jgi:cytochrome c biogenesis protein CcdA
MDASTISIAIIAGVLATFNPCGFALLPAYMGMIAAANEGRTKIQALMGGLKFASGMTVGFVLLFGIFGLVFAPVVSAVSRYLPIVTIGIGIGIIGLGIWLMLGRKIGSGTGFIKGWSPGESWLSQVGYGVTFAIVSLSCTLGPFLAVTGTSIRTNDYVAMVGIFIAFALGMGAAVSVIAVSTALIGSQVSVWMRSKSELISRITGILVILAGIYVTWFGWYEWQINSGNQVDDPVIGVVLGAQAWVVNTLSANTGLVISLSVLIILVFVSLALTVRVKKKESAERHK